MYMYVPLVPFSTNSCACTLYLHTCMSHIVYNFGKIQCRMLQISNLTFKCFVPSIFVDLYVVCGWRYATLAFSELDGF